MARPNPNAEINITDLLVLADNLYEKLTNNNFHNSAIVVLTMANWIRGNGSRRINELLASNNELLERARKAEDHLAKLKDASENLVIGIGMGWDLEGLIKQVNNCGHNEPSAKRSD